MFCKMCLIGSCVAVSLLATDVASAASVVVPNCSRESLHAAEGTVVVDGRVTVSGEGRLSKTGAGTVVLPIEKLAPANDRTEVDVVSGTLVISNTGVAKAEVEKPTDILNTAALWLDAAQFASAAEGSAVETWNDVRETDPAARTYPYAVKPSGNESPTVRTVDENDKKSVWFGNQYKDGGRTLHFKKSDGSSYRGTTAGTFFIVANVSNYWPNIIGSTGGTHQFHLTGGAYNNGVFANSTAYYQRNDYLALRSSRMFVNGRRIDTATERPQRGVQLLEFRAANAKSGALTDALCAQQGNLRNGGADIFEAVYFANVLTDAQCVEVEAYLMQKWGIGTPRSFALNVSKNATSELSSSADAEVLPRGEGTVNLFGETLAATTGRDAVFGGLVDFHGAAQITTLDQNIPVVLKAGDSIDVTRGNTPAEDGRQVNTLSAGQKGTVTKTGAGTVRMTELPQDAVNLDIVAGRTVLAAPTCQKVVCEGGDGDIYASIPNANFEEYKKDDIGFYRFAGSTVGGWTLSSSTDWNNGYYSHRLCTSYTWLAPWNAPEGDYVLCLRCSTGNKGMVAVTHVEVPVTGRYELSFFAADRGQYGIPLYSIVFSNGTETHALDDVVPTSNGGYWRHRQLTPELSAGTWTMELRPKYPDGLDCVATYDDFKMRLVTESADETVYRLPNGGFENYYGDTLARTNLYGGSTATYITYSTVNPIPGWTIENGGDGLTGDPSIALAGNQLTTGDYWPRFFKPNASRYGNRYLLFCSNGGLLTSDAFAPPKGLYALRVKATGNGSMTSNASETYDRPWWHSVQMSSAPKLQAAAHVGNETIDLGVCSVTALNTMRSYVFSKPFSVTEGQSVTISLAQTVAAAAAAVDEVELVALGRSADINLLGDPSFETLGGDADSSPWKGIGWNQVQAYSKEPATYGYDAYDGAYYAAARRTSDALWQRFSVPRPGLYRVTLHGRRCPGKLFASLDVSMGEAGVTNALAHFDFDSVKFRTFSTLWRATAAGEHVLRLMSGSNNADAYAVIDGVSVCSCDDSFQSNVPAVSKGLNISVASGSELVLEYPGTLKVASLRVNGKKYHGTVSAADLPSNVKGVGQVEIEPTGLMLIFR